MYFVSLEGRSDVRMSEYSEFQHFCLDREEKPPQCGGQARFTSAHCTSRLSRFGRHFHGRPQRARRDEKAEWEEETLTRRRRRLAIRRSHRMATKCDSVQGGTKAAFRFILSIRARSIPVPHTDNTAASSSHDNESIHISWGLA